MERSGLGSSLMHPLKIIEERMSKPMDFPCGFLIDIFIAYPLEFENSFRKDQMHFSFQMEH
jgi:hypothetical protein